MATIIDSLIVELGLDPTNFTRGQKQAASDIVKTRNNLNQLAKDAETAGKRTAQFFTQMREQVVLFFAAFTAGKGMKEFLSDVIVTDANMGRLARTMDMSVETLSLWGGAIEMAGGSADSLTHSMMNLSQDFANFALTGQSQVIPWLRGFGVQVTDAHNRALGMDQVLRNITKAMREQSGPRAEALGRGLGLDQGTINAIRFNNVSLERLIELRRRLGLVTQEDVSWQQKLQEGLVSIRIASESLGRTLLTWLSPNLVKVTDALVELAVWAQGHGEALRSTFVGLSIALGILTTRMIFMGATFLGINPTILAAAAALAALGAAMYYIWQLGNKPDNSKKQTKAVTDLTEAARRQKVQDFFNPARESWLRIKEELFGWITNLKRAWTDLGDTIRDMWKKTADYIKNLGSTILQSFQQAFNPAIDWLKKQLNFIWEKLGRGKLFEEAGGSGVGIEGGSGGGGGGGLKSNQFPRGRGAAMSKGYGTGAGGNADVVDFIRQAAIDRGIDPRYALQVAHSEGLLGFNPSTGHWSSGSNDRGTSFTPYQLHFRSNIPGYTSAGLGDQMLRETGIDARNMKNWQAATEYALNIAARKKSWVDWHGATGHGIWSQGLSGSHERPIGTTKGPTRITPSSSGVGRTEAPGSNMSPGYMMEPAKPGPFWWQSSNASSAIRGLNRTASSTTNNRSSQVSIGAIHVATAATDANGIAGDIKPALEKTLIPHQADYGQW